MANYSTYDSLFKAINRDIQVSFEHMSNQIVKLWKTLVEENFYSYNPSEYRRSFQSLDSISVLSIKKSKSGNIEVEIGYDISKIKTFTYTGISSGMERIGHENPSEIPMFVEEGFEMINGKFHDGAKAYEWLIKYIKGNDFKALFSNELKKMGYTLK